MTVLNGLPMDLLLEGIVAILLAATIGYCATLDRKLREMRSGQDGLRDLIQDLGVATAQASDAIVKLREASEATGQSLGEQVKRGRALADELTLIVEAGNRIADRLSGAEPRQMMPPPAPARPAPQMQLASAPRSAGPATRDAAPAHPLLDLLKRAR
jgi:hypothetical protein